MHNIISSKTLKILSEYPHLKVYQQNGREGMYQAIHQGFEKSSMDYICWVNCDDKVIKEGFEKMYETIVIEKLDLVYSDSILVYTGNQKNQKVRGLPFGKYFMKSGFLPFVQPSSIYRKELYQKSGGLNYNFSSNSSGYGFKDDLRSINKFSSDETGYYNRSFGIGAHTKVGIEKSLNQNLALGIYGVGASYFNPINSDTQWYKIKNSRIGLQFGITYRPIRE